MSMITCSWKWSYVNINVSWRSIYTQINGSLNTRIHHIICGGYENTSTTVFGRSELPVRLEFYATGSDLVQAFNVSALASYTFDSNGKILPHSIEIHGDFPPAPLIKVIAYGPVDFTLGPGTDTQHYVF